MAAALHFDISVHNFGIQEYMRQHAGDRRRLPRTLTRSRAARCIRATGRDSASTSTKRLAATHPYESGRICRSIGNSMGRCTHGDKTGISSRASAYVASALGRTVHAASSMPIGYAGITWGNNVTQAIEDISARRLPRHSVASRRRHDRSLPARSRRRWRELLEPASPRVRPCCRAANLSIDPGAGSARWSRRTSRTGAVPPRRQADDICRSSTSGRKGGPSPWTTIGGSAVCLTGLGKRTMDIGVTVVYHPPHEQHRREAA